jgi:pSer/pThr/pTyr-binding forkhead associated (FHA) protein
MEQLAADRRGRPYLLLRDPAGSQRLLLLEDSIRVGREHSNDLSLQWDRKVSRLHARIERQGRHWTVLDDGLGHVGRSGVGGA